MRLKLFAREEPVFDEDLLRDCKNCGRPFRGRYCNACGEKVVEPYERTIRYFLDHVFNAFTFIDGKFFTSFKTMILKPGQMTRDLTEGKRQPYMKPVAFFFVGNVIYFLIPLFETFNSTLNAQMYAMPYSNFVQATVNKRLAVEQINYATFETAYNMESTAWAKMLLIVLPVLFLPFVATINYSRKFYLSDQFLFSMEYMSYLIFVPSIIYPAILWGIAGVGALLGYNLNFLFQDKLSFPLVPVFITYFLIRGHHQFYQFPRWRIFLSAVLLLASMYFVVHAYRFILFVISMWTV